MSYSSVILFSHNVFGRQLNYSAMQVGRLSAAGCFGALCLYPFTPKNCHSLTIARVSRQQYLSSCWWISALRSGVVCGAIASW